MGEPTAAPLDDKLDRLPSCAGCYLFRDAAGAIVYVGKAKHLKSRVRSYFHAGSSDERYFLPMLRAVVADVETRITRSEKEAAVLENELIKTHQPRFNIKLKDDKDFLCLRLDPKSEWPRLETVRRPSADGARYFGPYHSAAGARRTLQVVNKHFQLRTCGDSELHSRTRPCLQFQIKRCPAPCVYEVDRAFYGEQVRAVDLFLKGRHDELLEALEERMHEAARAFEYELAARYRDQLRAVGLAREGQRIVSVQKLDQDALGLYREGELAELVLCIVKKGHVIDTRSFTLGRSELPDEELIAGFCGQYYAELYPDALPDELLVPAMPDLDAGLAGWLSELRGKPVRLVMPKTGARRELLELATENARHAFREKRRASEDSEARLASLQERLRLEVVPRTIECCDISHLGGGDAFGAIVAMRDAVLDKKRYRSFRVRTTATGDDYAAMHEVLSRRFRRALEGDAEDLPGWELPDLFVVDGGRGQLGVALAAAHDLGLHELSIVGLAKERESVTGEKLVERVYLPGQKNGIPLGAESAPLYLLAQLRDEAHRFANVGRERAGKRRVLRSELDDVPGIGPVARIALLKSLGSLAAIRAATDDELLAAPGVTRRHVAALRKAFGSECTRDTDDAAATKS
ncbi:MAG: excinuclease ABC subunit UvrC [Myxococcales bacterium]|nr:excinuclease ABC subunit UvrC [Myxococcales bacterium]